MTVGTDHGAKRVEGTLFGNRAPRLVEIFGIPVEAELAGQMIYIVNTDEPGFIGALGTTLGENGINIATFNLGRRKAGGEAVALVAVDDPITPDVASAARRAARRPRGRSAELLRSCRAGIHCANFLVLTSNIIRLLD